MMARKGMITRVKHSVLGVKPRSVRLVTVSGYDDYLAPEAAIIVLDTMVAHFAWLSEWIDLARKSAIAAAAVELARMKDAPRSLQIELTQSADEARMKLEGSDIPNGIDARQVLESFAKLQRVAARKPDVYL